MSAPEPQHICPTIWQDNVTLECFDRFAEHVRTVHGLRPRLYVRKVHRTTLQWVLRSAWLGTSGLNQLIEYRNPEAETLRLAIAPAFVFGEWQRSKALQDCFARLPVLRGAPLVSI